MEPLDPNPLGSYAYMDTVKKAGGHGKKTDHTVTLGPANNRPWKALGRDDFPESASGTVGTMIAEHHGNYKAWQSVRWLIP